MVLIVIDYGLSLTTAAVPERRAGQYGVILGTTKDTSTEIMRFMLHLLDLPPMQTRQKVEQVKAFFSAVENLITHTMKDPRDADLDVASLGWVNQRNQHCKSAT